MKIYQVNQESFEKLIIHLAGFVFHRKENGKFFIKPLKRVEHIVKKFAIN